MKRTARRARRLVGRRAIATALSVALLGGLATGATGGPLSGAGGASATAPPPSTPALGVPLATSVLNSAGTWATLPMGHLDEPLNTFWQLMFQPVGSSSWSDRVEATGVATNGGIVLAANARSLLVAVRPSNKLTYSPLILTTNAGHSWSTGLVEHGLAHMPSSLAISPSGTALALTPSEDNVHEVLTSRPGPTYLLSWETLLRGRELASSAVGRGCAPSSFSAVGYVGTSPVVGAVCGRAGAAGVFIQLKGHWTAVGPKVPPSTGTAEVIALLPTSIGLAAVIELGHPSATGERLLVAWSANGTTWRSSSYFHLAAGQRVLSTGQAAGRGVFLLLTGPGGRDRLAEVDGPGAPTWRALPAPPAGTQTVTFARTGAVQALAANQSVMDVWDLTSGTGGAGGGSRTGWRKGQALHVSIEYGSSS